MKKQQLAHFYPWKSGTQQDDSTSLGMEHSDVHIGIFIDISIAKKISIYICVCVHGLLLITVT